MSMHRTASRSRQRGLSFFGLIFVGLFAVAAFAIGGQSVPIFLEYVAAKKAIEKAKIESTVPAIRAAFDRAAAIDDINSVKGSVDNIISPINTSEYEPSVIILFHIIWMKHIR